jgi:hypothetical protein
MAVIAHDWPILAVDEGLVLNCEIEDLIALRENPDAKRISAWSKRDEMIPLSWAH